MNKLRARVLAMLVGVGLFALVLELGLRAGGAAFALDRGRWNRAAEAVDADLSVLCVGDSMTAGEYPRFLGAALADALPGRTVRVFDLGQPSTNSWFALERAEAGLARWPIDVVVAMLGFNDFGDALPYRLASPEARLWPHERLRLYKLLRMALDRSGGPAGIPPYPATMEVYGRLAATARSGEARLVVMQYPTLPTDFFAEALGPEILVVDNRDLFAGEPDPWATIYEDHFGGSFGHLNDRGNRALAQRLAAAMASWPSLEEPW